MADRPIPFSPPMVRALLDGRKTQTRRILKPQPSGISGAERIAPSIWRVFPESNRCSVDWQPPLDAPGDRLWVKEAWRTERGMDRMNAAEIAAACLDAGYSRVWAPVSYDADEARVNFENGMVGGRYRHARFMPRWASRLTLTVTEVRVQRLQEISEDDAVAEGLSSITKDGKLWKWGIPDRDGLPGTDDAGWPWDRWQSNPIAAYRTLWNSLHGPKAWDANPWVRALTFTVRKGNIDDLAAQRKDLP